MSLDAGARLGPYEVIAPIGTGGMGEVYRARDTRLGREVALKVLPAAYAADPERMRRFELEARAIAALNHPNILAIHDIGSHEGSPYLVYELLEGQTLGERMKQGALPLRKVVDYALQICAGCAASHARGTAHRDLKPENIFLTHDGLVKILDFGLAKLLPDLMSPEGATASGTLPGKVMGTVGYMSPEQVRGQTADHRSDIFSLGAVIYEMASGRRAFSCETAAETMAAILREDPPELKHSGLEHVVRHCLEKNPEERFQSARDLSFDLRSLSGFSETGRHVPLVSRPARRVAMRIFGLALLLAVCSFAAFRLGRGTATSGFSFRPLTFRPMAIFRAAFAPDGKTVVYSAALEGNKAEIFVLSPEYPDARSLGLRDVQLLSVSSKGELALLTNARFTSHRMFTGTLARMPLAGGAPREILENAREADWAPNGDQLAVIREAQGKDRLEFPPGKVLVEAAGYLSDLRFSPSGDRIAFFEHPFKWDNRGALAVVDLAGKKTILSDGYKSAEGLAWSPDGREVIFSADTGSNIFTIFSSTLSGERTTAYSTAAGLMIQDISRDGRWLATRLDFTFDQLGLSPGFATERNLSWLDNSGPVALSADGRQLLFTEQSAPMGENYGVCLRRTDGSPVVTLGQGRACDLSPDGKWALAIISSTRPSQLLLYPTGAGESRRLENGSIQVHSKARWFSNGNRITVCGAEAGHGPRCYVQDLAGGPPRAVTAEGATDCQPSPDGTQLLVRGQDRRYSFYPAEGGQARPAAFLSGDDVVTRWSADGRALLVYHSREVPSRLERVDLASGRRTLLRRLAPPNLAGVLYLTQVVVANDERYYAYVSGEQRSRLYLLQPEKK